MNLLVTGLGDLTADSFFDRESELDPLRGLVGQLQAGAPSWLAIVADILRRYALRTLDGALGDRTWASGPCSTFLLSDCGGFDRTTQTMWAPLSYIVLHNGEPR